MMVEKEYRYITQFVYDNLKSGKSVDNRSINTACASNGIDFEHNMQKVKESVEIAMFRCAKYIATDNAKTTRQKYDAIIDLYNRQPIVGAKKTLSQMVKQQYSTSLPVAFLMSEFVKGDGNRERKYFEPSAGNGFLTIALPQENTICNEIDDFRLQNLREEHYQKVINQDGRNKFDYEKSFDGVVMNPPFLKEINAMIFNALDTMKDDGRCAILRDDWNQFENYYGTMQRKKNNTFFDKLFAEYNVVKIINLDANKVYSKQGTNFYMQVILIDGRRPVVKDDSINRVFNPDVDKIDLAGFEELWEYFSPYFTDVIGVEETKEDEKRDESFNTDLKDANGETIYVYDIVSEVKNDKIKYQVQGYGVNTSSLYCRNLNNLKYIYLPSKSIVLKEKDTHKFKKGDLVRVEGRDGVFVINRYDGDFAYPPHYTIKKKGSDYVDPIWVYERDLILFGVRHELQEKEIKLLSNWNVLTPKDIQYLKDCGYEDNDMIQIDEIANIAEYNLAKIPETKCDIEKFEKLSKKVSFDNAIKHINRNTVIAGIARLAFHGWSGSVFRGNDTYTLELYVPKSYWFNGLSGIDDDVIKRIENIHKASDTIYKWLSNNKSGRFNIKLPRFVESKISRMIGRNVSIHTIDSNGIRHSIKNHGVKGRKLDENSMPIPNEYYMLIPYIMVCPDSIEKGSDDNNRQSIRFKKNISKGIIIVVEKESRINTDVFETINMWGTLSDVVNAKNPNIHVQNVLISTSDVAKIIKDAEIAIIKDK